MTFKRISLLVFGWLIAVTAQSKVTVVTTTTDIAWLAKEIGGEHVSVSSLLDGHEDPHFVDAIPQFISKVSGADIVCSVGLGLEIGWLPKILEKSGNRKVQSGGEGSCVLGQLVEALNVPTGPVNRSMGDVHPEGNPHFWLGPKTFASAGQGILDALVLADPAHKKAYEASYKAVKERLLKLSKGLAAQFQRAGFAGKPVLIQYHNSFDYLLMELGLQSVAAIEAKPGVSPSARRLAKVGLLAKQKNIALALASTTDPKPVLRKFESISGAKVIRMATSISRGQDYIEHMESLSRKILGGLNPSM